MKLWSSAVLTVHLLSCVAAQFVPTGDAALSPRDQLVRNPHKPPVFSENYRELPCPFYTPAKRVDCIRYDTMFAFKDFVEFERYANSELKEADGTFKKPDAWLLVQEDGYWINPARNKWLRFRKEVAPIREWFFDFDDRNSPKGTTTTRTPSGPQRPTTTPTRTPSVSSGNGNSGRKASVAESIETLSFKLWPKCVDAAQCSNAVYSPISISSILTLLMFGSDGTTEDQLRKFLGFTDESGDSGVRASFKDVTDSSKRILQDINNQLRVANGIFTFGAKVDDKYKDDVKRDFAGHFDEFQRPNQQSINSINKWVSEQTNNKIERVVESLPDSSHLVAVNTVYFKGQWLEPFGTEFTRETDFHVTERQPIKVQTMIGEFDIDYSEDAALGCKMIALPYKDSQMAMYLVLPTQRHKLKDVEAKLDAKGFEKMIGQMKEASVDVRLPKFRVSQKLRLKEQLMRLGVKDLFDPKAADLKRMIPSGDAAVTEMMHEAFVQVSETGTEAAAATTVFLTKGTPSKTFIADQPFLFFIRDKSTKVVYFHGRVVRPVGDN